MSRLRPILDRINDIEATIARVAKDADPRTSLASRITLASLENRRDSLLEELSLVTRREYVEICKPIEIKIHPPAHIGEYLDALIATGLYGKDRTAVANALFNDQLKLLLSQGVIERKRGEQEGPTE